MDGIISITNVVVTSTNALLNVLLPQVTQFAQRADLPEKTATVADVRTYDESSGGFYSVKFRNGDFYQFYSGYVQMFQSPHSYESYGPLNMTESEAIDLARSTIRKLGYTEEMLYADLEPVVHSPMSGTNSLSGFRITWLSPNKPVFASGISFRSAEFEINGTTKEIEKIWFMNNNLKHNTALPPGMQQEVRQLRTKGNLMARTSRQLMSEALPSVNDFGHALNLWSAQINNTNQVRSCGYFHLGPIVYGRIELTNGFSFRIVGDKVTGFSAPDAFFNYYGEVRVKDFLGKWKITQADAVAFARKAARIGGASAADIKATPEVAAPAGWAAQLVPRYLITWDSTNNSPIQVEVDASSGTVKSLTIH